MKDHLKQSLGLLFASLVLFSLVVWSMLVVFAASVDASVLSVGALCYLFGLRHAFDADHIAAIDNVTRKLRQDGQRTITTGLYFALGHSTIVILMSLGLIMAMRLRERHNSLLSLWSGDLALFVSAGFLTILSVVNLAICARLCKASKAFTRVSHEKIDWNSEVETLLDQRGFAARLLSPLYRRIDASWKMFPVGFLFGLGFDTATEIAVLGFSAQAAAAGKLPLSAVMLFPLMFTAGMTMVDAMDGALMMGIYDWAFSDPRKKLFFNTVITGLSALMALVVASLEWLKLLSGQSRAAGPLWKAVNNLDFSAIGLIMASVMLVTWLVAAERYRRSFVASASAGE